MSKNIELPHIEITIDDVKHQVPEGISIAAALIAIEQKAWRLTRHQQQPRGVFCGIGVCFDCLVTVNETANVRACLDVVQPGDVITTQTGGAHA